MAMIRVGWAFVFVASLAQGQTIPPPSPPASAAIPPAAIPPAAVPPAPAFTAERVMIPMRDGARLETVILRPTGTTGPLPILLSRTPYGITADAPSVVPRTWAALAKDGYIFVEQSMRGRFGSEGVFTLSTAVEPGRKTGTDEATDAWDTIDWLVKSVPGNSGRVGMWGVSYPGFAAAVALADPHPALKAVSPGAAWIDYWQNDDLHRNGALRLSYATDWLYMLQHDKADNATFDYGQLDTYDWFLKLGPVENLETRHFRGSIPMFAALLHHPDHDDFYRSQRWSDRLGRTTVPTLNVAGYWDQEDPWGSWEIYRQQEKNDPDGLNMIVAGPWSHGYWRRPADNLGRIGYGVESGTSFQTEIEAPFFAHWLHGTGARPAFEIKSFQSGSWAWKSYASWPPRDATPTALYLHADATVSFAPPAADEPCRAFVSDPANPVPNRARPVSPTYPRPEWQWWEAEDQRFVEGRPDVLSWKSAPLDADLTVTGDYAADLMAATSGTDADMVVKLIDVFPDDYEPQPAEPANGDYPRQLNGYQLPVAMEVRRGRWLDDDRVARPLVAGQVRAWDVPLRAHDHVFAKGHRIMVQVQSSWFPAIDRNPQTFVANIARAAPADFRIATHQVCAGSKLILPVMKAAPEPPAAIPSAASPS